MADELLGTFTATAYGPPWDAMQGTGVTAGGTDLRPARHAYIVAVDPSVIPLGTRLRVDPNPFDYSGAFLADDTGGAIKGNRLDIYDWRGRSFQLGWGARNVKVWKTSGGGGGAPAAAGGRSSSPPGASSGSALVSDDQRSGLLKALVWVLLVIGGAAFVVGGTVRAVGASSGGRSE